MSQDPLSCPRCGEPFSAGALVCPECGADLSEYLVRMRCNFCGRRIPADTAVCPRCGRDPRFQPPRFTRLHILALTALLLVCCGWLMYRAAATNVVGRALEVLQLVPTATPAPTARVILVVASPVPPTHTLMPLPIPALLVTPSPMLSPGPTRRGAPSPTFTRTFTPTPPGPTPTMYPAVQVIAPKEGAIFQGADADITLEWQGVVPVGLRVDEWYMVSVMFSSRDSGTTTRIGWSRETRWRIPEGWWNDIATGARLIKWSVAVVRIEGIDPFASSVRIPASPASAWRSLIWN